MFDDVAAFSDLIADHLRAFDLFHLAKFARAGLAAARGEP